MFRFSIFLATPCHLFRDDAFIMHTALSLTLPRRAAAEIVLFERIRREDYAAIKPPSDDDYFER